jgi:hypothetical protein
MVEKKSRKKSNDETSIQVNIKPGKDLKNCFSKEWKNECHHNVGSHCGGAVYGLGFVGVAIYFISTAIGFWMGVLGFLKAIIWPVFVVYGLLKSFEL